VKAKSLLECAMLSHCNRRMLLWLISGRSQCECQVYLTPEGYLCSQNTTACCNHSPRLYQEVEKKQRSTRTIVIDARTWCPSPDYCGLLCSLTGTYLILSSRNGHPTLDITTLISRYGIQGVQFMNITSITEKIITKVNTKERGSIGIRGTIYECITL
jgi:hypothetical protein